MESIFAIGVGLVLRIVLDVATDNDDRVSSASCPPSFCGVLLIRFQVS